MVQDYSVEIGLPVVERWEQCAAAMWSLTQGRNGPVPQPYPTQTKPASFPNGSSNFVYHGLSIKAKSIVRDDMVDEYNGVTDELSADSPVNYQLSHCPSPSPHLPQMPTTPSHSSTYRTPTTSPLVYHKAQTLSQVDSPVSPSLLSQNSSPFATPNVEALAKYYTFLTEHDLLGFIPSLDTLQMNFPISSWFEEMKHLDIPVDKIDTVMILMANVDRIAKVDRISF